MWIDAEKFLQKDKHIGSLIKRWGSCTIKPLKKSLYFQDLVDAICSQQLSIKAAKTIFNRVKDKLGKVTPENILSTKDEELRSCGLSWSKVSYVKDLALKTKNKELDIRNLDRLPDDQVIGELVRVKGIGRWTAEMFLMFSLGRPDILPLDDLGIKNALKKLNIEIEHTEAWRPYRTVASWYLWRSLEND